MNDPQHRPLSETLSAVVQAHAALAEAMASPTRWGEGERRLAEATALLEALPQAPGAAPDGALLRRLEDGIGPARARLSALDTEAARGWFLALGRAIDHLNSLTPASPLASLGPRSPTLARFAERHARMLTPESLGRALAFQPRRDDVLIATYTKSGTTWLQQILHALRGGEMDFTSIGEVVPALEAAWDLGVDPDAEQPGRFRVFKTHMPADRIPSGARYVVCLRDPEDVLVSTWHFFAGWLFDPDAMPLEDFAFSVFVGGSGPRIWTHQLGWWRRRQDPQVHLLTFEDLKRDLSGELDRLASWLGLSPSDPARARALERSSFEFMRLHRARFADTHLRAARNPAMGLPVEAGGALVRSGRVGDGVRELNEAVRALLAERWSRVMTPETGLSDYTALRARLREERAAGGEEVT